MIGMTLGNVTHGMDIAYLNSRQKDEVSYGSRLGGGTNEMVAFEVSQAM
jgi:hypothetical protein